MYNVVVYFHSRRLCSEVKQTSQHIVGKTSAGTARFAAKEWRLHVKLLAHCAPVANVTPHCFSTSTGPFFIDAFGR
jgi:hypothetical protein